MGFGILLLLFPGVSGTVFVWLLAAGSALYGLGHLFRYMKARKSGQSLPGDL